jgi:hypothetical protein
MPVSLLASLPNRLVAQPPTSENVRKGPLMGRPSSQTPLSTLTPSLVSAETMITKKVCPEACQLGGVIMIRVWIGLLLALPSVASAVPSVLTHQGRVLSSAGEPLQGALDMTVSLFDEEDSVSAFWSKTYSSIPVEDGYYALRLVTDDAGDPISINDLSDGDVWLQTAVSGQALGARQQLGSIPYAMMSGGVQLPPAEAGPCETPGVLGYDAITGDMLLCHAGSFQVLATAPDGPPGNDSDTIVGVRNPNRSAEWALLQVAETSPVADMAAWRALCVAAGLGVPASIEVNANCVQNVGDPRYVVTSDCNMYDQRGDTWRANQALFQSSFSGGSLHFLRYSNSGSAYWTQLQCSPASIGDGSQSTCPTVLGASTSAFTLSSGDWLTCARPL